MAEVVYRCPECGSEEGLYVRADLRWNAGTREWEPVLDSIEEGVDCTECDHVGPIAAFEVEMAS
jgi:DNA-directed RNA polymerase subunit RPC12/RpoP